MAKEITFKALGENLFLTQIQCLGDWNRVMEGGPWLFRGAVVVMEEYDGFTNVKEYKLNKIPVWVRIQGLPEGLMKKKDLAEKVARKIGNPPITLIVNEGRINPSSYLRARVFLELDKPLIRVVPITIRESRRYLVQYEKLPTFCFVCGVMGHELTECGEGVHDISKCQWGDWLLVKFSVSNIGRGIGRGSGARGGMSNRVPGRGWGVARGDDEDEDMEVYEL